MFTDEELEELQALQEFYNEGVHLNIDNQRIDFFEIVANIAWGHKKMNDYTERQLDDVLLQMELYDNFWQGLEWFHSEPFHTIRMKFCASIHDYRYQQNHIDTENEML